MIFSFECDYRKWTRVLLKELSQFPIEFYIFAIAFFSAAISSTYAYLHDFIVLYGDAESHLNIAKRVIDSITPGAAQLGGIWLPLPHILLTPFVAFDFLWRSGLAGSIISGTCYIICALYIYKTTYFLIKDKRAAFVSSLIFIFNPNVLYLQATPMTELTLMMFFILSSYYFLQYVYDQENLIVLMLAAFFGLCATLSRYEGWFLVFFEALAMIMLFAPRFRNWKEMEGKVILFCTLAFFGIAFWFLWDWMILGDPLYFTNSQFSAKTQQLSWKARGELPAYHNILLSFAYYFVTSMSNVGVLVFLTSTIACVMYLAQSHERHKYINALVLLVPFIFNIFTLFAGMSVIFIPHLTPVSFEWRLFNVRYGVMMVPTAAFLFAYLFKKSSLAIKWFLVGICVAQLGLFVIGYSPVISLEDGRVGLSRAKRPDAETWIRNQYDGGLVLMDDYARTVSLIRSGIPMQKAIYIGNREYWTESFYAPEKYARWIIMQRDDTVWKGIYENDIVRGRLFKYFKKVYTSPDILIFKRA